MLSRFPPLAVRRSRPVRPLGWLYFASALFTCFALSQRAQAHGIAGARLFISTMLIDDPNVADEATLPLFFWLPQPTSPGTQPAQQYQLNFEWDKRITENFGFAIAQQGGVAAAAWAICACCAAVRAAC